MAHIIAYVAVRPPARLLTGFEVYDENGNLLPDAIVTGAGGARYTTLGGAAQPVPEPASLTRLGLGLIGVASRAVRRR